MIDYACYYRRPVRVDRIAEELPVFDIFISAFNNSDRVKQVFSAARAQKKIWLIHPEYQYEPIELPGDGVIVAPDTNDEIGQISSLLQEIGDLQGKTICVDTTGFMRHVLIFLVGKFSTIGCRQFTALYSEPLYYQRQERTTFTTTTSGIVRPIRGMGGVNSAEGRDHLILGVGFDHKLIGEVAHHKDNSMVFPVFAFPSLSPDMYQQSAMRASESGDIAHSREWISNRRFAPANDPFSTASVLREIVQEIELKNKDANIYLSPLSTKVQVLGFSLYWWLEGRHRGGVSIILPECLTYSRETSVGLKRLWTFTIET
ncbi:hypothetical protein [Cupriavidus plantarum]|uniref:Uncharacterized protein n=1 Tax=Cupriavidus plantarum TaxID=942865 RepID=A0A316EKI2_9BURK|nr:hypothetical protein [Cupriavidus plantarum]PWK31909.1 hypothetical protein C7419_10849 [Cupriavidus plantarum]